MSEFIPTLEFLTLNKLTPSFYKRDTLIVAKDLLNKFFVRKLNDSFCILKIVEVEAYVGNCDQAAHSFIGQTQRNNVMFQTGGQLYVYFTYGMHYCLNVVTSTEGIGDAVLIRAMQPLNCFDILSLNRFNTKEPTHQQIKNLANGPAKICQALNISKNENGIDLQSDFIFLSNNKLLLPEEIIQTKRIGIKKSVDLPWRFYIKNNPYISKK